MRVIVFLLTGIALAFLHIACEKEQTDPITMYFWPLQEGKVFVYDTGGGGKRTIRIEKVTWQSDERVIVETEDKREGPGLSSHFTQPRKALYELDLRRAIISLGALKPSSYAGGIVLKGPVRKGTTWDTQFTMSGPINGDIPEKGQSSRTVDIKATGVCLITGIVDLQVLGMPVPCAQYTCPIESKELSVIEDSFSCKGIGNVESSITIVYKNGRQAPFIHREKLIEMK